jgi:hypothetical protein
MSAKEPAVALPVAVVMAHGPVKFLRHYRWQNRETTLCNKVIELEGSSVLECEDCAKCEKLRKGIEVELDEILTKWRKWHGLPD